MAQENTVKHALRWMLMGKGATQAVNWLVTIVVIRLLTPADYGLLAMAMVLIALAQMFRDMGLQHALVQAKHASDLAVRQVFTLVLLLNISLCGLLYVTAPLAASYFDEPALRDIIRLLAIQFPLLALQSIPLALLARNMRFKVQALIETAAGITNSAVTLALALLDYGVWSLVWGNLVATLVRVTLLAFQHRMFYLPTLDFSGFRNMFSFGGFVMLSSFLNYLQNKSAHWLIGSALGKEQLGIYSVSNRLATLPMQKISGILNQVGFAAFSQIQDDRAAVRSNFLQMQAILAFFAFPTFWGIAAVTEALVPAVLGEKWLFATVPLEVIALAVPLRMLFNTSTPALNGIGNSRLVFTNLLISALTLPFAYYLALPWGVVGVSMVWVSYYPLLFGVQMYRTTRALEVGFGAYLLAVYRPVVAAGAMYVLVKWVFHLLSPMGIAPAIILAAQVGIGALLYLGASLVFNRDVLTRSRKLLI